MDIRLTSVGWPCYKVVWRRLRSPEGQRHARRTHTGRPCGHVADRAADGRRGLGRRRRPRPRRRCQEPGRTAGSRAPEAARSTRTFGRTTARRRCCGPRTGTTARWPIADPRRCRRQPRERFSARRRCPKPAPTAAPTSSACCSRPAPIRTRHRHRRDADHDVREQRQRRRRAAADCDAAPTSNAKEPSQNQTALMWAAGSVIRRWCACSSKLGADAQAHTRKGFTALHFAAREGDLESTRGAARRRREHQYPVAAGARRARDRRKAAGSDGPHQAPRLRAAVSEVRPIRRRSLPAARRCSSPR